MSSKTQAQEDSTYSSKSHFGKTLLKAHNVRSISHQYAHKEKETEPNADKGAAQHRLGVRRPGFRAQSTAFQMYNLEKVVYSKP